MGFSTSTSTPRSNAWPATRAWSVVGITTLTARTEPQCLVKVLERPHAQLRGHAATALRVQVVDADEFGAFDFLELSRVILAVLTDANHGNFNEILTFIHSVGDQLDSNLWHVSYGDLLAPLRCLSAGGDFVNGVNDVGAVIPVTADITYADGDILQDDESVFVLERLALDSSRPDRALTILALITIHKFHSSS